MFIQNKIHSNNKNSLPNNHQCVTNSRRGSSVSLNTNDNNNNNRPMLEFITSKYDSTRTSLEYRFFKHQQELDMVKDIISEQQQQQQQQPSISALVNTTPVAADNLIKQNRILINYKKLNHFENCLLRSRAFLKKNFDLIHSQIKATTEISSSNSYSIKPSNNNNNNSSNDTYNHLQHKSPIINSDSLNVNNNNSNRTETNNLNIKIKNRTSNQLDHKKKKVRKKEKIIII